LDDVVDAGQQMLLFLYVGGVDRQSLGGVATLGFLGKFVEEELEEGLAECWEGHQTATAAIENCCLVFVPRETLVYGLPVVQQDLGGMENSVRA
jgi:hypothetical protein